MSLHNSIPESASDLQQAVRDHPDLFTESESEMLGFASQLRYVASAVLAWSHASWMELCAAFVWHQSCLSACVHMVCVCV